MSMHLRRQHNYLQSVKRPCVVGFAPAVCGRSVRPPGAVRHVWAAGVCPPWSGGCTRRDRMAGVLAAVGRCARRRGAPWLGGGAFARRCLGCCVRQGQRSVRPPCAGVFPTRCTGVVGCAVAGRSCYNSGNSTPAGVWMCSAGRGRHFPIGAVGAPPGGVRPWRGGHRRLAKLGMAQCLPFIFSQYSLAACSVLLSP